MTDEHAVSSGALRTLAERIAARAVGTRRYLVGIAGSPGSGKSTLAAALADELNAGTSGIAAYVPMDGFHLANSTLARLGRADRKGALDTFDGWGFLALLDRIRSETDHVVYVPSYVRGVGEGVAGEIAVEPDSRIVLVEGNYLLVESQPWGLVRDRLDESWFCATPDEVRLERLVARHVRHGRTVAAATAWATEVDGANAALIEPTAARADLVVSGVTSRILRP